MRVGVLKSASSLFVVLHCGSGDAGCCVVAHAKRMRGDSLTRLFTALRAKVPHGSQLHLDRVCGWVGLRKPIFEPIPRISALEAPPGRGQYVGSQVGLRCVGV